MHTYGYIIYELWCNTVQGTITVHVVTECVLLKGLDHNVLGGHRHMKHPSFKYILVTLYWTTIKST